MVLDFLSIFEKAALQLLKANIVSYSGRNYHRVLNAEYVRQFEYKLLSLSAFFRENIHNLMWIRSLGM